MEDNQLLFYSLVLLPYALTIAMPGWRWLLVPIAFGIAGAFWVFAIRPSQIDGLAIAVEQVLYLVATGGLVTGLILRTITLALASRGTQSWIRIALHIVGAFAAIGTFLLLTA